MQATSAIGPGASPGENDTASSDTRDLWNNSRQSRAGRQQLRVPLQEAEEAGSSLGPCPDLTAVMDMGLQRKRPTKSFAQAGKLFMQIRELTNAWRNPHP